MSDCSQNAMSAPKPIHGEVVWKDGMRPTPLSYARYVNGVERVADHIDFDGERYERVRECEVSHKQDGIPRCSLCQNILYDEYKAENEGIKNFCDECGAKVRKAVKR